MRPYILHGHERAITYLKYSPDGDVFFSASKDFTPTMWRAADGERIGVFNGHSGAVFQLDTTSDTKYLFSASMDSTCHIWDVLTGEIVNVIQLNTPIRCLAVSEGDQYLCLCTMSFAGEAPIFYIYDISNGVESIGDPKLVIKSVVSSHTNIFSLIWTPLNKQIIACDSDGMLHVIDAATGEVVKTIKAHEGSISCLVASYDRTLFATASKDAKAKVFDMFTQEEVCCFATDRPLNGAALSPILNQLVVVGGVEARDVTTTHSQKMESLFYNLASKEEIGRVKGSFGTMNSVQFSPDGRSFITGGEDGYVRLCFFDEEYFTKDGEEEKKLRDIEKLGEQMNE
ncbi:hypothetical protein WA556_001312 [Blastocystis sp. ATCC 50177/Nand II]